MTPLNNSYIYLNNSLITLTSVLIFAIYYEFTNAPDVVTVGVIHDLNLDARFADQIVLLNHGRIVTTVTPSEVLIADRIRDVFQVVTTA